MKNILKILTLTAVLTMTSCKKGDSVIEPETPMSIGDTSFIFSINEKNEFENELALKIESNNNESVRTYKTKNLTENRFDKIIFSDDSKNDFIIESNMTSDTTYVYQRDETGNKTKEGLRYLKLSATEYRLDFVLINEDKSVTTLNQYTLTKKSISLTGRAALSTKKSSTDIDDLENEINETGEFLADPTNTHPITAFYKGVVTGLFNNNEENDVFDEPSKGILSTILDGLDSKRENILRNLGKISDFIKESKNNIEEFTQEQIDELIEDIKEDELTYDEIDDDILKDCKGIIEGPAVVDMCGECVESFLETCEKDCNEVFGGTAYLDNCEECVGGKTGKEECDKEVIFDFSGNWILTRYETNTDGEYIMYQWKITMENTGIGSVTEFKDATKTAPDNEWKSVNWVYYMNYNDKRIGLNTSNTDHVIVNNINDQTFYSTNWDETYTGEESFTTKHKLEKI